MTLQQVRVRVRVRAGVRGRGRGRGRAGAAAPLDDKVLSVGDVDRLARRAQLLKLLEHVDRERPVGLVRGRGRGRGRVRVGARVRVRVRVREWAVYLDLRDREPLGAEVGVAT